MTYKEEIHNSGVLALGGGATININVIILATDDKVPDKQQIATAVQYAIEAAKGNTS